VDVTNAGRKDAEEIVQLYLGWPSAAEAAPQRQLAGFKRVALKAGQTTRVSFTVTGRQMSLVDEDGRRVVQPGKIRVWVGGRQPDRRSEALAGTAVLSADVEVTGTRRELDP